ncbi:mannose-1-phosphate guanylyltransferase [Psychroflexus planctonicus]|uniref:Mannose-1-phosphate guanylyltransferase n=1 Tax=Psychroflexus planctonicus TaxID=1526575 RepID=A0ABQ1SEV1_9FLAO|nr:mannose-1-phosphate guanylyltransferase [Psychroflexus planctonicus]GGE24901.1 mannose-1-phosphate guanylyltransferase [Psychroflexus planctonicus]
MTNKNNYAILMAGGVGSRFWPVSRASFPKQFHDMLGSGKSLLQSTFTRLEKSVPTQNIFILTNANYASLVKEQLPQIENRQIVLEPAMRNTAPCILLAGLKIQKENPNAQILVAPSDHWIENEEAFTKDILAAFDAVQRQEILMTLGVKPTFPNTGYGYIKAEQFDKSPVKRVERFTEKPDFKTAQSFLSEGNYFWNAGIFIWSAKAIVKAFEKHEPQMFELFKSGLAAFNSTEETQFLDEHYAKAENISIDYAILEKADNVYVLEASFDWSDLGTWGALYEELPEDENQNVLVNTTKVIADTANGNIVRTSKDKLVVIDGLQDYIIVDHDDALIIVPKEKEQDIKQIRANAVKKFGSNYQ